MAQRATLEDVIERIDAMGPLTKTPKMGRDADALLGLVDASPVPITQALKIYLSEIAQDEQSGKSPEQLDAYCPSSYKMAQIMGQAKRDFAHLFG